ncbi:MAG: hemerythrin domain-containing protein [Anaerolineae bacterium]
MQATEVLKHEHRAIERMLLVLEGAAQRLEQGEAIAPQIFEDALDFVRTFADACHHGKEEDTLFPFLEVQGIPREGGPIGIMLMEHEQGRQFVRAMAQAVARYEQGDGAAGADIIENARGYVGLLREHILKEDNVLFPMADQVLSVADQQALVARFEEVERERIGEGEHERLEQVLEDLERVMRLRSPE